MSSLADLPELVGFFSYSREDDADSQGALSALRNRIQGELRGQLGRTAKTFRLWQDKEAIASGTLWETEIKTAAARSVFFIPIITPTVVASPYCRFELDSFLAREAALGRSDLIFPILYIDVPALEDSVRRQNDPVLSLIAKRQYVDWRGYRYLDVNSTDVKKKVGGFCEDIRNALERPWLSPQERKEQEEAAARQRAEVERKREAETKGREEDAPKTAADARARERAEEERRHEAEAEQKRAEAERQKAEDERLRDEAEAKRHAEEEERRRLRRSEARPVWPLSRSALVAASLISLTALGAITVWLVRAPPRQVPPPTPVASAPVPLAPTPVAPAAVHGGPTPVTVTALSPARERALKPGNTFKECSNCPELVVVPAGSFTMGSPMSERGHNDNEGPQHPVTIARPLAVGKFDVTFDEWDACAAAGGCDGYRPSDQGWGRGRRPVIEVDWYDAKAYVTWLVKTTGKTYRLLSESEWEYAARAGTTTAYYWGNNIGTNNTNCDGCGSLWDKTQTAPVGSFSPNQFGLYDMAGNVDQWLEDCYHDNYDGAPADGLAWISVDCKDRVVRGGYLYDDPRAVRSADRGRLPLGAQWNSLGFRVGRTLTP
jgi:formylglycine-generating enzyme required for sulfatase activity